MSSDTRWEQQRAACVTAGLCDGHGTARSVRCTGTVKRPALAEVCKKDAVKWQGASHLVYNSHPPACPPDIPSMVWQGRDANRKLQRAIKAGKTRERMPAMLDRVRDALNEWRETEGASFLYDGRDYEVWHSMYISRIGGLLRL